MKTRSRGLSLIEVIIGVALVGIIGGLFLEILVQNNGIFFNQSAQISQGLTLNDAMNIMTSDIKNSAAVVSGYPASSPTVVTGGDAIVLELPSLDSNNQVINQTYDYETISADPSIPTVLRAQIYPDPQSSRPSENRVLTSSLSSISFTYTDLEGNAVTPTAAERVSLTLTLSDQAGSSSTHNSSSATVNLRNN